MKIINYRNKDQLLTPAVLSNEGVLSLKGYLKKPIEQTKISDIAEFITSTDKVTRLKEEDLSIGPCVAYPEKIICIGLNYRNHAIESGMEIPKVPVAFTKYNNTLTDYCSDIPLGRVGNEFDYEVELGVVIGKTCKDVSKETALENVFGYCVANDLSCRDLQFMTPQWLLGKSLDKFLPLGKYLVTADEIPDPQNLELTCTVNGEIKQQSNTADMIFSVAEIIEFLSNHMTLVPGDLILTGTPEGVAMGQPDKKWLVSGDTVRVEIESIGYTENRMI